MSFLTQIHQHKFICRLIFLTSPASVPRLGTNCCDVGFWLPHLFTILETVLNCLQRWLHFFLGNSSWRSPQPFWGTETENQFAFVAHALTPSCPTPGLTVLLFAIQVSWPLGARLHRAPIFLFISLFSTDTWPTSQCVQKQETAGMGPLKKKKEEAAREFTSFEHLHVWVFAWILAQQSSNHWDWVFYPCSHGEMMCKGVKLCPHSSD